MAALYYRLTKSEMRRSAMLNTLCFFEIPADDPEALQKFYGTLFGWTFEKAKVPGRFRLYEVKTGADSPRGGLTARQDPAHTIVNYVKVESVDDALAKAQKLGAMVVVPKKPVEGVGWYAVVLDPQGNRLGLWTDDPSAA